MSRGKLWEAIDVSPFPHVFVYRPLHLLRHASRPSNMPEYCCCGLANKDIGSKAGVEGKTSGLPAQHSDEYGAPFCLSLSLAPCHNIKPGRVVLHPKLLANPNGSRQSVTLHYCTPNDPIFLPLPKPRKAGKWEIEGHCNSCATTIYDDGEV